MSHVPLPFDDAAELPTGTELPTRRELYDAGAEQSALGAILMAPELFPLLGLAEQDFGIERHRDIYRAMVQVAEAGGAPDPQAVWSALQLRGAEAGGMLSYLAALAGMLPTPSGAAYFVKALRAWRTRRELALASTRIADLAYSLATDPDALPSKAMECVLAAAPRDARADGRTMAELLPDLMALVAQRRADPREVWGIATGFAFDQYLGGLQKRRMTLLAGDPGQGKSAMAGQIVTYAAKHNVRTAVFSLEMDAQSLVVRMLSEQTGVSSYLIQSGKISEEEEQRLLDWAAAARQLPLIIFEKSHTVASLRLEIMRLKAMGFAPELIVVDYARRLLKEGVSELEHITSVFRELGDLAKQEDAAMFVIHSLNRAGDKRIKNADGIGQPTLGSLAYGGDFDADVVITIATRVEKKAEDLVPVTIAKHRHGREGTFNMHFDPERTRWSDPSGATEPNRAPERSNGSRAHAPQQFELPSDAEVWERATLE